MAEKAKEGAGKYRLVVFGVNAEGERTYEREIDNDFASEADARRHYKVYYANDHACEITRVSAAKVKKAKEIVVGDRICNDGRVETVTELFKPAGFNKSGFVTTHCDGYIEDEHKEIRVVADGEGFFDGDWFIQERDGVIRQIRPSDKGENAAEYWSGTRNGMGHVADLELWVDENGERDADVRYADRLCSTPTAMIHGGEFIALYCREKGNRQI